MSSSSASFRWLTGIMMRPPRPLPRLLRPPMLTGGRPRSALAVAFGRVFRPRSLQGTRFATFPELRGRFGPSAAHRGADGNPQSSEASVEERSLRETVKGETSCDAPISDDDGECCGSAAAASYDDAEGAPFVVRRAVDDFIMEVPGLPPAGHEVYATPTKLAHVALPRECTRAAGVVPNAGDKRAILAGEADSLWIGRLAQLRGGSIASLVQHARGVVILVTGSGGASGSNVRYMRMLAALGFVVVAPDTMAYTPSARIRHRPSDPSPNLSDYWSLSPLYTGGCSWLSSSSHDITFPFCYSSDARNINTDVTSWLRYYQRIYTLREREMDEFVRRWGDVVGRSSRVFLMGQSEGGMVVSRYANSALDAILSGRIISSWSCDCNYMIADCRCRGFHSGWPDSQPVLSLIGDNDAFFSKHSSIAADVHGHSFGGETMGDRQINGNCHDAMTANGLKHAVSLTVVGAGHDLTLTSDNLIRDVLSAFVDNPEEFATCQWVDSDCLTYTFKRAPGDVLANQVMCTDSTAPKEFSSVDLRAYSRMVPGTPNQPTRKRRLWSPE